MEYSIVVPIFNEEGNINNFNKRLSLVMNKLKTSYEIIFVNDGSTDKSHDLLTQLWTKDKQHVKVVNLTRNFGQHAALMAGFEIAQGAKIVTIDCDLQMPPEEIPKLIKKLAEGHDIVFGVYGQTRKDSFLRKIGSKFAKYILSKLIPNMSDISGFRILKRHTVIELLKLKEKNKMIDGLLCWMGYDIDKVEIKHNKREVGKSKYSFFKLIAFWLDMVVSLTYLPLKIAIFGGAFMGLSGLLLASYYFIRYLIYGTTIAGFTTLTILIALFSGIQLFCIGIIGEYLGRTNKGVMNKPEFIVRGVLK